MEQPISMVFNAAINSGDLERVQSALKKELNIINRLLSCGATPLTRAIQDRRIELACYLIEKGADPSLSDQRGMFPMQLALTIEINEDERTKLTAALLSAGKGNLDLEKPVYQTMPGLHYAIWKGWSGIAGLYIDHGAHLDENEYYATTPLMLAACHMTGERADRVKMLEKLVTAGADPDKASPSAALIVKILLENKTELLPEIIHLTHDKILFNGDSQNRWYPKVYLAVQYQGCEAAKKALQSRQQAFIEKNGIDPCCCSVKGDTLTVPRAVADDLKMQDIYDFNTCRLITCVQAGATATTTIEEFEKLGEKNAILRAARSLEALGGKAGEDWKKYVSLERKRGMSLTPASKGAQPS